MTRFAIYFTPAPGTGLDRFGDGVLGFDNDLSRSGLPFPFTPELEEITREARVYGFHATLKAPMILKAGISEADLISEARTFARFREPASLGKLEVASVDGFCALVPAAAVPAVDMLAAECVAYFDPLREPLNASDRDRRLRQALSPRQVALLDRWGYPYVFEEFRFHMTLTTRLDDERRGIWLSRLRAAHADISHEDVVVDALSVLRQDDRHRPFRLTERIPFA